MKSAKRAKGVMMLSDPADLLSIKAEKSDV